MIILFPLIFALILGMLHYLSYTRVIKRLHIKTKTETLLLSLLSLNFIGVLGFVYTHYFHDTALTLYYLFSLSIGVSMMLFFGTIIYEFLHLLQHKLPLDESKRKLFKRTSDAGFLALGSAYIGAGVYEGSKTPTILGVEIKQKLFNTPKRVVQISDLHIGGLIDKAFVKTSVEQINSLHADVVVITGDLIDASIERVKETVDELKAIDSRLGVYYIVGNHEYFHGIESILAYMKSIGVHVLENSALLIEDVEPFYIAGVYDVFGYRHGSFQPDIQKAYENITQGYPVLLLAHQPRYIYNLEDKKPDLILSGHTHGGQIWPFNHLVKLQQPFLKGLHELEDNRHIYINSGIGFWGPPMRLGSSAEITNILWN